MKCAVWFAGACALALTLPVAAETVAIVNARIEPVSGPAIPSGTLVLRDGKIVAVGANAVVPTGARVVDGRGGVVTPGLVAPSTNLGASEIGGVRETRDDANGASLSAGFDIQYSLNPASPMIGIARDGGVTSAAVTPVLHGGDDGHRDDGEVEMQTAGGASASGKGDPALFAGQAAFVRWQAGEAAPAQAARIAVALDLGERGARAAGGSRGASLVLVRAALQDARALAGNRAAFEQGRTRSFGLSRIDLEALLPVIDGRTPLLVRVHRVADIRQALKLGADEKIKLILEGAEEGWQVAAELAKAGVPVIIDSEADLPDSFETLGARLDNAALLQAAGVLVAVNGARDFNNLRQQRLNAGLAVAYGLPYEAALASVTLNPAKIWGQAGRIGSLEVGKSADVVLWTGDPLEIGSWPQAVFVAGVEQPKGSRATKLRDRYAAPEDGALPAYRRNDLPSPPR